MKRALHKRMGYSGRFERRYCKPTKAIHSYLKHLKRKNNKAKRKLKIIED